MKHLRLLLPGILFISVLSSCGSDKPLTVTLPKGPFVGPVVNDDTTPSKLPIGGVWNATLQKEDVANFKPSIVAVLTVYDKVVHEKTTCSFKGTWVSAEVIVPATIDEKNVAVQAGNQYANPTKLDLGNGSSYSCTAQMPQGTFPYEIVGDKLTLYAVGQGQLSFQR